MVFAVFFLAPDDLSGIEFVYRTQDIVRMKEFGDQLQEVIRSILPSIAPIHLTMDGFPDQTVDEEGSGALRFSHQTPVEASRLVLSAFHYKATFDSQFSSQLTKACPHQDYSASPIVWKELYIARSSRMVQ
jgi:hypothetical protein